MNAIEISLAVTVLLVLASLSGALLRRLLPTGHLDEHTRDVVRLSAGLIATIVGLVLGLLISSAKSNFDVQRDEVRQLTAFAIMLDNALTQFGPESRPARLALRRTLKGFVDSQWGGAAQSAPVDAPFVASVTGTETLRLIVGLAPSTEEQRFFKTQATTIVTTMLQQRLVLYEQGGSRLPALLVVVLVGWLFVLFASFSLFSPLNPTAIGAVTVIAVAAAGAFFLIFEMFQPFDGLMQIDKMPLLRALSPLPS